MNTPEKCDSRKSIRLRRCCEAIPWVRVLVILAMFVSAHAAAQDCPQTWQQYRCDGSCPAIPPCSNESISSLVAAYEAAIPGGAVQISNQSFAYSYYYGGYEYYFELAVVGSQSGGLSSAWYHITTDPCLPQSDAQVLGYASCSDVPSYNAKLLGGAMPNCHCACACGNDATRTGDPQVGEPTGVGTGIDVATGNVSYGITDYLSETGDQLSFSRYYNSLPNGNTLATILGPAWRTNYDRFLSVSGTLVSAERADGRVLEFAQNGNRWSPDADVNLNLTQSGSGVGSTWSLTDMSGSIESYKQVSSTTALLTSIRARNGYVQTLAYNSNNLPTSVTDSFGRSLSFAYGVDGTHLSSVTTPDGLVIGFQFATNPTAEMLSAVTYSTSPVSQQQFTYRNTANVYTLTQITDENGNPFIVWDYDSYGRGRSIQLGSDANPTTVIYDDTTGQRTVTNALGITETYGFSMQQNAPKVTQINRATTAHTPSAAKTFSYDANGFLAAETDWNGNITNYTNDTLGRQTKIVQAVGTPQERSFTQTWLASLNLPLSIAEPNRTLTFNYDSNRNLLSRQVSSAGVNRLWRYTYDSNGHVLSATGPRTDVAQTWKFSYNSDGTRASATDPLGHTTEFMAYDPSGRLLGSIDPNGLSTQYSYDARGRLLSRIQGGQTTSWTYDASGNPLNVTNPDSSFVTMSYDNDHRLTDAYDSLGNHLHYAFDSMGDITNFSLYGVGNRLSLTHSWSYDALGRAYQDIGAAGTSSATTLGYDNNGNLVSIGGPLGRNTSEQFDSLNRLTQITNAIGGVSSVSYDASDNVTQIIDPRALQTSYGYDGLGDNIQQASADTGAKSVTYDSTGNRASVTDARGVVAAYSYDALNRVTQATYKSGGIADQTITYAYDAGNGVGRLTGAGDANHSLAWSFDSLGHITTKVQTVGGISETVGYTYANNDLTALTTPSGQKLTYIYSNGQVTGISINGAALLSQVVYEPFGPVRGWAWANGSTETRLHDADGNPNLISGVESISLGYDSADRLVSSSNWSNSALSWNFGYDLMDRLTSATNAGISLAWSFDANGNRLQQSGNAGANSSISPGTSFTYNNRGRMSSAAVAGATTTYVYDALGQLIYKKGAGISTLLVYDEAHHLLGEYTAAGALIQETVWLGDIPVATIQPGAGGVSVYYVHSDQINTPRTISRPSDNTIVWRWDLDPYGTTPVNSNPAGLGTFTYNLRLPGQYYQAETGLNYNYYRDYDPNLGRYIEADPIGLGGGLNPYAYVNESPLRHVDPTGTFSFDDLLPDVSDANESHILTALQYAKNALQDLGKLQTNENNIQQAYASVDDPDCMIQALDNGATKGNSTIPFNATMAVADSGIAGYYVMREVLAKLGLTLDD